MKVFLIGPMVGHRHFNAPAFDTLAESLFLRGFAVVNPIDLRRQTLAFEPERYPTGNMLEDYPEYWTPTGQQAYNRLAIALDFKALQDCDAACMLPGWQEAYHAVTLHRIAQELGMFFIYAPDVVLDAPEPPEEPGDDDTDAEPVEEPDPALGGEA